MSEHMSGRRAWWLCTLLFMAGALSYLDRQVLSILAPKIISEFGMSNTDYSRVLFAFVLAYTVMFSVGGRYIDRIGTRLGLTLSVSVWSIASAAHAFVGGTASLWIARFVLGAGEGPCFPAVTKGAIEWVGARRRALAVGFANGGSSFGAVLAAPLTVWFTSLIGWRGTFLATGILGLLWVLAWHFSFRGVPAAVAAPPDQLANVSFRSLLARPVIRRLLVARFLFDPVFYFYMFWIPQYFSKERGMSLAQIGALFWIPYLVLGLVKIDAGRVSDLLVARGWEPIKARMTLMGLAAALTPASFFSSLAGSPAIAITLMSVLMLAHGVWITNYMALIADTVAPKEVATTVGLTGTAGGIAGMISQLAIGPIVDHFSFSPVFLASAVVYPLAWLTLRWGKGPYENQIRPGVPA
jgi:ACS family hexuronate transporter-like MFS transporter